MNERDIFLVALEITDPDARRNYLDEACGGNAALRVSVEALFASHDGAGSFLKTPITQPAGSDSSTGKAVEKQTAATEQTIQLSSEQLALNTADDDSNDDEIPLGFLTASTRPDSLGRLGHYEVLEVLGKGAFGTVLKAFDEKLHRMVAIKVMSTELASTSPARKRFLREARAAAAIRHEHVVAIYAVEEQPIPYLVMEYIPGKTLQQAQDEHGPFELNDTLRLGQQIASGLAAAHLKGLIHRDIKPANILLEEGIQWKVKITDFGLARAADDASMTQSGTIAGTPMYMSPERAHSSHIDQRSDLFSFGSVLYQMASGRPPFRASSTLAVLKRVTEDTPRPIQEIIPEVPDWLCTIISKLHSKQPADRYQTAGEVAELLARCQSELDKTGRVTCVPDTQLAVQDEAQSSHHAPRDEPSTAALPSPSRPSPNQTPSPPAVAQPSAAQKGSSRRSETATFNRPRLIVGGIIGTVAIIAILMLNRFNNTTDPASGRRPPSGTPTEISNSKSQISNAATGWHGWPADAPPPAIAPFDAEQAKQHQEAWAKYLNVPVEYTNSIGMKFRLIPPCEFVMGAKTEEIEAARIVWGVGSKQRAEFESSAPQHNVIVTQPFYLAVHEVTQGEYEKVMGKNPSHFAPAGGGKEAVAGMDTARHPVEMVTWNDAAVFCARLSSLEMLQPFYSFTDDRLIPVTTDGIGYRLPTEAEWEFACTAGTVTRCWLGDQDEDCDSVGWIYINSDQRTHPVGERKANPFGLYDVQGNVWEWMQGWWGHRTTVAFSRSRQSISWVPFPDQLSECFGAGVGTQIRTFQAGFEDINLTLRLLTPLVASGWHRPWTPSVSCKS